MILLDTNVISEPMRRSPDGRVIRWIDTQPLETLYLSAITVAELRAGVAHFHLANDVPDCMKAWKSASSLCLPGAYCRLIFLARRLMQI